MNDNQDEDHNVGDKNNADVELQTMTNIGLSNDNTQSNNTVIEINQTLSSHIKEYAPSNKTGMFLSAKNLSYYVRKTKVPKEAPESEKRTYLIKDFNFSIKPGKMILLMGSPGSGKSVLLKILANRLGVGELEGTLLFNNRQVDPSTHQKDTIYVPQEDKHLALLTVKETMEFSARCNMGDKVDDAVQKERVNLILEQIGLSHTVNTIVGNEFFRGISGGQKRRVTIATEFTKCPNLILMDEPTTGLDSATSFSVISKVKTIATEAKASAIVSLLQPSPELTALFDDVLLLHEGKIAYFGPMENLLPYFSTIGLAPLIDQPVAEFIQEVVEEPNKYRTDKTGGDSEIQFNLAQSFKDSIYYQQSLDNIDSLIPKDIFLVDHSTQDSTKSSIRYELKHCLSRHLKVMRIMKMQYVTRFSQSVFMGLLVGTLFYDTGFSQADARNRFGLMYYSMVLHIWTTFGSVEEFFTMRSVFYDQKDGKYYRTFPYFLSLVITKIPVSIIEALLFSIPCYWLAGFRARADSFFVFVLGMALTNFIAQGVFQTVSVFTETQFMASMICPAIIVMFMMFSGYMLPGPDVPGWWIWMYYISPLKYTLDMIASNELFGVTFTCSESERIPPPTTVNFTESYPYGFEGNQICPQSNGVDFLSNFGMSENFYFRWIDLVIILAMGSFMFTVFFFGLKYVKFEVKKPPKMIAPKKKIKKDTKVIPQKHTMNGCYMTFENLGYSVPSKQKNKATGKMENLTLQLLKNINGFAKPGLMALMGPSGAGKSTLLDVLSKRKNLGTITGKIMVNNVPIDDVNLTRFTGYVEQLDILSANLTIREAIEFSANCRLPGSYSFEDKNKMIDEILKSQMVIDYFNGLGYQHDPDRNPADFILELSEHPTQVSPVVSYQSSHLASQATELLSNNRVVPDGVTLPKYKSRYSAPLSMQLYCLVKRGWLNHIRRPTTILMRFLRSFIPAVVIGTMFLRIDNDQMGARNKLAMIFLSFLFAGMASIGKIPLVVEDRAVYYREFSAGTYPSILYLISTFITDIPMMLLTAVCYWIPSFFLTGLSLGDNGWKFFFSFGVYFMVVICYDSLAVVFALTCPTIPIATLFSGVGLNFLGLFGGFFIPKPNIPRGWIWMHYLVFSKYGLETLGITEWKDQEFECPGGKGSYDIPIGNTNQTKNFCPIRNGNVMIERYGFDVDRQYYNVLILAGFILAFLTTSYLSLRFIKHMKR
eukprot:gene11815-14452_t